MPIKLQSRCIYPACNAVATVGSRCAQHARSSAPSAVYDAGRRHSDPALAAAARFRSSARWQKFRLWFSRKYPLCCDPLSEHRGFPVPTQQVHHVIGLAIRPDLGLDEANCRPLCTRCHWRVERMERAGQATQHLFAKELGEDAQTTGGGVNVGESAQYTDGGRFSDTRDPLPPATLGSHQFNAQGGKPL